MKYKDLLYVFDYTSVFDVNGLVPVFDMNNEALPQTQTDSKIHPAFLYKDGCLLLFFFHLKTTQHCPFSPCVSIVLSSLASPVCVRLCGCAQSRWGSLACENTPLRASGHYCLSGQTSLLVCPENTTPLPGPLSPRAAPMGPLVWDVASIHQHCWPPSCRHGAFPDAWRQTFVDRNQTSLFRLWNYTWD